MIPFNTPPFVDTCEDYMMKAARNRKISGDGEFTANCSQWMQNRFGINRVLLTTSCSHALDISARLCMLTPGDEVIMPSYTFSSTANAFVGVGAKIVFTDIRPDTMNINENLIEAAITERTRAIVVMHYAGVPCEMDTINRIAEKHGLIVVEDAAQGILSLYKGRPLGTLSRFGSFSFHETKNFSMGEGGALLLNCSKDVEKAEIIREKGTDRSRFFRGQVDKYSWVDWGSSYLPSELNAAYLWAQLEQADTINEARLGVWKTYYDILKPLEAENRIALPVIPADCVHNAHMFYIKTRDLEERTRLIQFLKERDILAVYHYVPLHSADAGKKYGRFHGEDCFTTKESNRLVRLPLYFGLSRNETEYVANTVIDFYKS